MVFLYSYGCLPAFTRFTDFFGGGEQPIGTLYLERHRDRTYSKAKFYGKTPVGSPNDRQSMPTQAELHSLWVRVWNWIAERS